MSKSTKVQLDNLVSINPVTLATSLDDTYCISMQIAVADKTVKARMGSVYQRLLHEAVQIANATLAELGGESFIEKMNYSLVAAKFVKRLNLSENKIDANCDEKQRPGAWKQSKSDINVALKAGFKLLDNPSVSSNTLRKEKEELIKANDAASEKAEIEAHNKKHGITEVEPKDETAGGDAGDVPAGQDDKGKKSASAGNGKVKLITPDQEFKDPALAALVSAFIAKAMELEATTGKNRREKTGADVAISTIMAATDTLDTSLESFNNAMAKLAEAS